MKTITVGKYYAGTRASGRAVIAPQIRIRGAHIARTFEVGQKLRVVREMRAGQVVLVLEALT